MSASLKTDNDNTYVQVEATSKYFTQAVVTSNSDRKQIVIFNIDGEETRVEGSGEDEEIGDITLPDSFNTIKVYVSYVDDNGNIVSADTLETGEPTEVGGYNMATIRAENGDEDDDYEVEIKFQGEA